MARQFQFDKNVQSAAHKRQNGRCAHCGVSLVWEYDKWLSVMPTEGGGEGGNWRHEVDNCVIVCNGCFMWLHTDHTSPSGSPTDPDDYPFSHGNSKSGAHKEWAVRMMGR
jgi:hypothetical protein